MLWSFLEKLISKITAFWESIHQTPPFSREDYSFNELSDGKVELVFVGGGNPEELELVSTSTNRLKVSAETADIVVSQGTTTIRGRTVNTVTLKG